MGTRALRPGLAAALLLAAGCAAAPPAPAPVEEWDRELPAGLQLECFWSDDLSDAEDAAEEVLESSQREWDLRESRGEDAGPEPAYAVPRGSIAMVPVRVVDDATGEPVPGARIDNWWEADTPHAEPWEDLLEGSWTTDRDGWALVPARDHAFWYYVEAPGYAPMGEMALEEEYRLVRGRDSVVEVRDWRGRPVPGATVDMVLGCGHAPNGRCETAGPDGRLTFRCVDDSVGDLWIRAPGLAGRNDAYGGWDDLPEENGVRILRGEPGLVLEGLVLRPDGTPAAGARVGTREAHRGPWTVAGADGRYRLVGARPHETLIAMAPYADPVPEGFMPPQVEFQSVPGVFATVHLPAEGKRWPTPEERDAEREKARGEREAFESGEEPELDVLSWGPGLRIVVKASPDVLPLGRVRVVLVREGDGRAHETSPRFKDGVAARAVLVEPGTWTVTAGDPAGLLRPESRTVEVKEGWAEASFTLQPNPTWKPRVIDRAADGSEEELAAPLAGRFVITTEDGVVDATPVITAEDALPGPIHVPASGPFAVEYRTEDGRRARVLLDGPPTGAGPTLVLPPPVPEEPWVGESTRPRDFPMARYAVLLPDGSPAGGAEINAVSAGSPAPNAGVRRSDQRYFRLDDEGTAEWGFDRGDRLLVVARGEHAEGILPFETRIDGPGPWTIHWPVGEVAIRAVDEAGNLLEEFAVLTGGMGGYPVDAVGGVVRLRGASKGPLRFWVAAPGRRVHDLRLVLAEGEKREVVVRMTRAAPPAQR